MSESSRVLSTEHHAPVPLWRDVRVLRWLFQIAVLLVVAAILSYFVRNLRQSLSELGLTLSFDFLTRRAGFGISEGPPFDSNQTMWRAYLVGVVNTLRAAGLGIVLATVVGTIVGVARLTRNWLVSRMALVYIEIFQNTPLLVQLFFWLTLIQGLPRQRREEIISFPGEPIQIGGAQVPPLLYLSQRGAALPGLHTTQAFEQWWPFLILGVAVAAGAWRLRVYLQDRQGRPPTGQFWWAVAGFALTLLIGDLIVPGAPLQIVIPVLQGDGVIVRYLGGWVISPNLQALLIGLVLYTGAFIAEVVRAGIQSVSYGQVEAATSLGLTRGQQLRLIILPQALRVIIPPLINQYLNLTKNSSLAIAVAYPDLFNVSQTIGNQTGQNIQVIALVMATYLSMSLSISLLMNVVNKRIQIVER